MPVIRCYISDETQLILQAAAFESGREMDELAESAIANAAIEFKKIRSSNWNTQIPLSLKEPDK